MIKENGYQALTPAEEAIEIVRKCFENERNGDKNARKNAALDFRKFLVKTDDGSYTLNSNSRNGNSETMHTYHGAITESLEKFVKPARLEGKGKVRVLDICSGLGYNAASCIEFLDDETEIEIDMVEISKETVAASLLIENPVESYEIIKMVIEEKLFEEEIIGFKFHKSEIPDRINISIYLNDARDVVKGFEGKNRYDAVFLDPFSPSKCPELYTLEFFLKLKNLLQDDGIILTYTSAAPVRSAMIIAGLHVGEGPKFGRKSGGTVAAKKFEIIEKSLSCNDERMVALSDAGIPFRDPQLNESSDEIINMRETERKSVRGVQRFASTVKTPLYLYKNVEDSRLKIRVIKNINLLLIDNLIYDKSAYVVCPQFEECICSCRTGKIDSSSGRINEMIKRLSILIIEK
jgi:tRNA U34 5-methylaminomethyl-2-thiouridine-forming methyltransferase MnmC